MGYKFSVFIVVASILQTSLCIYVNIEPPGKGHQNRFPESQSEENADYNVREGEEPSINFDVDSLKKQLSSLSPQQLQQLSGLFSPGQGIGSPNNANNVGPPNNANNVGPPNNADNVDEMNEEPNNENILTNNRNNRRRRGRRNGRRNGRNGREGGRNGREGGRNGREGDRNGREGCNKHRGGYGSGSGIGYGEGRGNGSGMGYGSGTGIGVGNGRGIGFGEGQGYGSGSGYGMGRGYGRGGGNMLGLGSGAGYAREPYGYDNPPAPPSFSGTQGSMIGGGSEISGVKINSIAKPNNGFPSRMASGQDRRRFNPLPAQSEDQEAF